MPSPDQEIIDRYSTPGLKRNESTRASKKFELQMKRYSDADIKDTLDKIFPEDNRLVL